MDGMFYGYPGDVNNTIPMSNMYPGGRATSYVPPSAGSLDFRNNSAGELNALNQDAYMYGSYPVGAQGSVAPSMDMGGGGMAPGGGSAGVGQAVSRASANNNVGTKPATSWLMFFVVFVIFVWVAKRYDKGGNFANVRLSIYNGVFLTLWIVLILNFLKVLAAKVKIPGLSELILAA